MGFVVLLLLTPWVLYLGLGNLFLNAGGVSKALGGTREISIHYHRAWTLWPGRITIRGLHFTFQDANVQFAIDLDRADLTLALLELPSRTFHATKLRGSGTAFRMRHRIQPDAVEKPWVKALGPIPEFSDPPLFEASVPPPPIPEAQYRLWTIHMEDVDVGVSELWVQFIRYRGEGRATGAFRLRAARNLWVGPAALELTRGRITVGNDEIVRKFTGRIGCVVHPFDVRVPTGLAVLRHITSQIKLRGEGLQVDSLPRWFSKDPQLELDLAPGELEIAVDLQHGRGMAGSYLALKSDSLRVQTPPGELVTKGLSAQSRISEDGRAHSELRLDEGEVSLAAQKNVAPARFRELFLGAELAHADAADPPSSADRSFSVQSVRVPDARWLNGLVKAPGFVFVSGSLQGHVALSERQQRATGKGALDLEKIRARAGDVTLRSEGHFDFSAADANTRSLTGQLQLDGNLSQLEAHSGNADGVEVSARQLVFHGHASRSRPGALQARLHAESVLARGSAKELWFRAQPALDFHVDGERETQRVLAELELRGVAAGSNGKSSDCPWLKSPSSSVRLERDADSLKMQARVRKMRLGWGDLRVQGDTEAKALVAFARNENQAAGVTFSLRNSGVHVQSGHGKSDGWEATLPSLNWNGEIALSPKHPGYAELGETRLSGRVGSARIATSVSAHLQLAELDVEHKHTRFAANVRIGPADLDAGGQKINDWWARITLGSGLVTAGTNLDMSALFQAELRDATPGVALLAERGSLPQLFARNIPLQKLSVTGIIQRRCRLTDFVITQASGGPFTVRGRLNSTTDSTRAALLLRVNGLEALSVGLALDPEGTDVTPLAGDTWLREHQAKLDVKAREILAAPCPEPPGVCEAAD